MSRPDEGLIHAWLDGELDAAEAARIEALVGSDAEWAAAAAEARGLIAASSRILGALDHVPAHAVPAESGAAAGTRPPTPSRRPSTMPWWITRAAAVLVVAVGIGLVYTRTTNDEKSIAPDAAVRAAQQRFDSVEPAPNAGKPKAPDLKPVPPPVSDQLAKAAPARALVGTPAGAPAPATAPAGAARGQPVEELDRAKLKVAEKKEVSDKDLKSSVAAAPDSIAAAARRRQVADAPVTFTGGVASGAGGAGVRVPLAAPAPAAASVSAKRDSLSTRLDSLARNSKLGDVVVTGVGESRAAGGARAPTVLQDAQRANRIASSSDAPIECYRAATTSRSGAAVTYRVRRMGDTVAMEADITAAGAGAKAAISAVRTEPSPQRFAARADTSPVWFSLRGDTLFPAGPRSAGTRPLGTRVACQP